MFEPIVTLGQYIVNNQDLLVDVLIVIVTVYIPLGFHLLSDISDNENSYKTLDHNIVYEQYLNIKYIIFLILISFINISLIDDKVCGLLNILYFTFYVIAINLLIKTLINAYLRSRDAEGTLKDRIRTEYLRNTKNDIILNKLFEKDLSDQIEKKIYDIMIYRIDKYYKNNKYDVINNMLNSYISHINIRKNILINGDQFFTYILKIRYYIDNQTLYQKLYLAEYAINTIIKHVMIKLYSLSEVYLFFKSLKDARNLEYEPDVDYSKNLDIFILEYLLNNTEVVYDYDFYKDSNNEFIISNYNQIELKSHIIDVFINRVRPMIHQQNRQFNHRVDIVYQGLFPVFDPIVFSTLLHFFFTNDDVETIDDWLKSSRVFGYFGQTLVGWSTNENQLQDKQNELSNNVFRLWKGIIFSNKGLTIKMKHFLDNYNMYLEKYNHNKKYISKIESLKHIFDHIMS